MVRVYSTNQRMNGKENFRASVHHEQRGYDPGDYLARKAEYQAYYQKHKAAIAARRAKKRKLRKKEPEQP